MAKAFVYPTAVRGKVVGLPYQGSHTMYGNWESDNAIDIAVPYGTPIFAVADGVIGSQIGPLNSKDPHLEGSRVHLVTAHNEVYYAHLSKYVVRAGEHVRAGQLIGYSGRANGLDHLHIAVESGSPVNLFGDQTQIPKAPTGRPQQEPAPQPQQPEAPTQSEQPVAAAAPAPVLEPQAQLGIIPELAYPGQPNMGYSQRPRLADTWQLIANLPDSSPDTQAAYQHVLTAEGG